jgi:ABC-2 type transport system permease protein
VTLGNQILSAFREEKENRVAEMLLTTIDSSQLLIGKVVSLAVVGLIQVLVLLVPTLAVAASGLAFGLDVLVFDPVKIGVGVVVLIAGFALYLSAVLTIGMLMPSVKETGPAFTVVLLSMMAPLYLVGVIVSSPENPVVQFLTYFPLTSPITALVRNAVGTLAWWQGAIAAAVLLACAAAVLWFANRICRQALISYTKKLSVKSALASS